MRVAIVDDSQQDRQELRSFLTRWCAVQGLCPEISEFESGECFVSDYLQNSFELIFLDIFMGQMDGIETARRLREMDKDCRIVFLTTSHAHAVESYQVRASYYLTKPLGYEPLQAALDLVCRDILNSLHSLSVTINQTIFKIPLADILYLDSVSRRPCLHLPDNSLSPEEKFSALQNALLSQSEFVSCNRNLVVNMKWIDRFSGTGDLVLKNGCCLPVRQHGRAEVRRQFLDYSLRELKRGSQ